MTPKYGCENDAPLASTPSKWKLLFKETPDDGSACREWADLSLYQSIVENDVMEMTRVHVKTGMHVSGSTTRRPIANTRAQGGQASAIK